MTRLKLELDFLRRADPNDAQHLSDAWPIRGWVDCFHRLLQGGLGASFSKSSTATLHWIENGSSRPRHSRALVRRPAVDAKVIDAFDRLDHVSAAYACSGFGLHLVRTTRSPGAIRLLVTTDFENLVSRDQSAGLSDMVSEMCVTLAELGGASFGEVIQTPDGVRTIPLTVFESCLTGELGSYAEPPPEWLRGGDPILDSEAVLRGYGWITVVPPSLATAVMVDETNHGTALYQRHTLGNGALLLRATRAISEYDEARARDVWTQLRPVLRAGEPRLDLLNYERTCDVRGWADRQRDPAQQVGHLIVMADAASEPS